MAVTAFYSASQALNTEEATHNAAQTALVQTGSNPVVFGIVIASRHHLIQHAMSAISPLAGDIPLIGISSSMVAHQDQIDDRAILVAFLAGDKFTVRAERLPGFSGNGIEAVKQLVSPLLTSRSKGSLLLVAEGSNGDARQLCAATPSEEYKVAGCMTLGSLAQTTRNAPGDKQSSRSTSLAAVAISGNLIIGVGTAHGWQPVGALLEVTSAQGPLIQMINGLRAADFYKELFQYPSSAWSLPPLNELVRLYPLGLAGPGSDTFIVYSPLRMEPDGSLRMDSPVPTGSIGHLLVGSSQSCRQAARQAASQAVKDLGKARPVLGILVTDIAWQMLFKATPGEEIRAVQEVLGTDLPIIGAYTYGQIVNSQVNDREPALELLNQHLEVILFGDRV